MPTVSENYAMWNTDSAWDAAGDRWSDSWGGPKAQWAACLLPRVQSFLPARTILEIAPGYGRWTQFLKNHCETLEIVDMEERCIAHCRERFAGLANIRYHVNDGTSLAMIEDGAIDFVFSFDSLVHVEADCLGGYLRQLSDKLTPNGVGFIHHSNLAEYGRTFNSYRVLPEKVRRGLVRLKVIDYDHWRARSVAAGVFDELCRKAGLVCIGQECITWGTKRTIDCISLFTKPGSEWERPNCIVRNRRFMREADAARRLAPLYYPGN